MTKDLHMSNAQYNWLLTIFYISYIVVRLFHLVGPSFGLTALQFEFQALMWKVVPPHIWGAFCVFGWGLVSTVQSGVHSWAAMMALRFFMGLNEAGYGPGITYLLSFFYLRHEL